MPKEYEKDSSCLILGANGFLGQFFLEECLKESKKIYLLIRSSYSKLTILERLKRRGFEKKLSLLEFYIGDASLPKFGLSQSGWKKLSSVNKIFNLAGSTNFLQTRQELHSKNVEIVKNSISLAQLNEPKEIHHISTLSILLLNNLELNEISENTKILKTTKIYGGYAQSKFQAEFLLKESNAHFYIYRLGLLVGDTQEGVSNPKDAFTLFLKAFQIWKDLDFDTKLAIDFLPVDIAAKSIFEWSEKKDKPSLIHIFGETVFIHEIQSIARKFNLSFTPNQFELEYTKILLELIKHPAHRIHPLGFFLKTQREFTSNYFQLPVLDKRELLEKILKNLASS